MGETIFIVNWSKISSNQTRDKSAGARKDCGETSRKPRSTHRKLWDGNGGRVILNKYRMPTSESGKISLLVLVIIVIGLEIK